jgi:ferritin-like protein
MTPSSLAKYVTAESPIPLPPTMPPDDVRLVGEIAVEAKAANDSVAVRHVGPIYRRIAHLLESELQDVDFRLTTAAWQAHNADWGYQPRRATEGEELIVVDFPGTTAAQVRTTAVAAVRDIAEQGEGFDLPPAGSDGESHFERFLDIYKRVSALPAGTVVTWPVVTNPNTATDTGLHLGGAPALARPGPR